MKIVFVITDYGSFNNFLSELSRALSEYKKVELHVVSNLDRVINLKDKFNFEELNINFHYVKIPRSTNLISIVDSAWKISLLINAIKPDIIHAHFTTSIFPSILFRNKKYKYWGTFHGLGMNSSKGLKKIIFSIVEYFCFVRLDRIFLTNEIDYILVNQMGFTRKALKYKCYGFGCNINEFNMENFSEDKNKNLKNKLLIKEEKIIVFTGRFVNFKGFDLVIKAFLKLNLLMPYKFKLLLIGGYDYIHTTGLSTTEKVKLENCSDIINIGFTNEVAKYLAISDIFLFPSKKEGLPTCVMEALSMGVPTIVSDSRGSSDLIKDGFNGVLIKKNLNEVEEIESIVETILEIHGNTEFRNNLSCNALKLRHLYSRRIFIEEHISYYFSEKF